MALSQSAVSELLDAIRAGGSEDDRNGASDSVSVKGCPGAPRLTGQSDSATI